MIKRLLLLLALSAPCFGQLWSGILDPARATDWTQAGIPGGIPDASWTQCTTGACATANSAGTSATLAQLNAALTTCGSNGNQYVLLASGTYPIYTDSLNIPSNCVLRGAGPQATIITKTGTNPNVVMGLYDAAPGTGGAVNITGGGAQGSTSITVASTTGFAVNGLLMIGELDSASGASQVGVGGQVCGACAYPWTNRSLGQVVKITSIAGTTIGISPALYTTYSTSGSDTVGIPYAVAATNCGVENLQIYGNNTNAKSMIELGETNGCWVKGVEVNYTDAEFVRVMAGIHNEVRDNYFSNGFIHGAGSSDGTVFLGFKASANVIENNIIERTHTSILINWGAAGNVIAYNYTLGAFTDTGTFPSDSGYLLLDEDIATHGATPQFNLVEGNQAGELSFDAYWGSDFNNTLFRNWFSGVLQIACPGLGSGPGAGGASPYASSCAVSNTATPAQLHTATIQWAGAWPSVQNMRAEELNFTDRNTNSVDNVVGSNGLAAAHPYDLTAGSPVTTSSQQNWAVGCPARSYDSVSYGYNYGYAGASDGASGCDALDSTLPFSTRWRHLDYDYYLGATRNNDGNIPPSCGAGCSTAAPVASFFHASKPSWWGNIAPWPANGSDVTGGLAAGAGHVNNIPAAACYINGTKTGNGQLAFNPVGCYGGSSPSSPPGVIFRGAQLKGVSLGKVITGGGGGGAPLTYTARTDNCELGSEASGAWGCNGSATTGQQGATLSYLGRQYPLVSFTTDGSGIPTFTTAANTFVNGQTVSFQWATEPWLNSASLQITSLISSTQFKTTAIAGHNNYTSGTEPVPPNPQAIVTDTLPSLGGLTGAGNCITDPDFGSRICRLTDYTAFSAAGLSWNLGSDGDAHRFSPDSPPSMILVQNSSGNNCIIALAYSGSGASTVITSTKTAVCGNASFPATAYTFSAKDPHILWEIVEQGYDWTTTNATQNPAATCNPPDANPPDGANTVLGAVIPWNGPSPPAITCEFVVQLNKLTLGCTGAGTFPVCAGSALGILTRTKTFEFNCLGPGCPATSMNQSISGGINTGTDSPNCLPFNFASDWNGIFLIDDTDVSMTVSVSDNGQAGKWTGIGGTCTSGATKGACLGASQLINWTQGKGCRLLDSHLQTVKGDWGPTGAIMDGQPNVITQVANQPLTDIMAFHEGQQSPDASWAVIGAGVNPTCASDARTPPTITGWNFIIDGSSVAHVVTDQANSFVAGQQLDFSGATGASYTWINSGYYTIAATTDSTHLTLQSTGHGPLAQSPDFPTGTIRSATSPACSCGANGIPTLCNSYYWNIATLTENPCGTGDQGSHCVGHNARGFVNDYRGKYYTANSHNQPSAWDGVQGIPNTDANGNACANGECRLFPAAFPGLQSGTYQNHGTTDQPPVGLIVQNACGIQGNENAGVCDPQYNAAWYDEFIAGENFIMNSDAKHCGTPPNGAVGTAGCNYRFAHPGNSGDSWNFNASEAITIISKDGTVAALPTDWSHGFGCTDGTAGPCLSPLQGTAPADETINSYSTDGAGILTVVTSAAVKFVIGSRVTITGTGYPSWLITPTWVLTGVSGNNFTAAGGLASQSGGAGTAKGVDCSSIFSTAPCSRADVVIIALPTAHQ